jgi:hypothetical protein
MHIPDFIKRITLRRWSWIFFKVGAFLWALHLILFTPPQVAEVLPSTIYTLSATIMVGALISIGGLVMVSQHGRTAVIGLTVELVGIVLVALSTFGYLITQVYLVYSLPDGAGRIAFCYLLVWILLALVARFVIVFPRRQQEGHDPRKDA